MFNYSFLIALHWFSAHSSSAPLTHSNAAAATADGHFEAAMGVMGGSIGGRALHKVAAHGKAAATGGVADHLHSLAAGVRCGWLVLHRLCGAALCFGSLLHGAPDLRGGLI